MSDLTPRTEAGKRLSLTIHRALTPEALWLAMGTVGWTDAILAIEAEARVLVVTRNPEPIPDTPSLREAALALLDAEAEPAYSWVIESQQARDECRPNREVERMDRINRARIALRAALAERGSPQ